MQPGIPLTALHGKIKQERRTLIYMDFVRKKHACLFATDIAARFFLFLVLSLPTNFDTHCHYYYLYYYFF